MDDDSGEVRDELRLTEGIHQRKCLHGNKQPRGSRLPNCTQAASPGSLSNTGGAEKKMLAQRRPE